VNKLVKYLNEDGEWAGTQTINWLLRNSFDLDAKEAEIILKRRKLQIAR